METSFKPTAVQFLYRREPLGIYYARLYAGNRNKWVSLKTKVFSVAKLELAKRLQTHYALADAERRTHHGKATVGDLAAIYLQDVELDGSIKPTTKEYRGKTVKYLFKSWHGLATKPPNRITELQCRHWAAEYRGKFSETLYNNTVDTLRHLLELAIKHGLIARNPAAGIEKIKVPQKKLELPSTEQFKAIIEWMRNSGSATSEGNADLVEFLAYSGARANEAADVRWQDIDFERGRIYIAPGKTGHARYIPLLDAMRDLLDRIKADPRWFRAEHRRKAGYILSVVECEKALTAACRKASAHRMTRHDLRHLYATRCIEAGVDIPTVSRWLGHRDGGALAMRTYGHLRDEHSQRMAAKVSF
jgi:site-specific recombinase XerD